MKHKAEHKKKQALCASDGCPHTEAEANQVREQLSKMLSNHQFTSSKRCCSMLQYVVERSLEGKAGELKERILGLEVFQRDPNYDTSADPIVRVTATELRKRIALYYLDPKHKSELYINIPPGSYIPKFAMLPPEQAAARGSLIARIWPVSLIAIIILGLGIWLKVGGSKTTLDLFWKPILDSPGSILICIPAQLPPKPDRIEPGNIIHSDVMTTSKIVGYMTIKAKGYDIRTCDSLNMMEMRQRPTVLIGAFNNQWTMRMLRDLPFSFEKDDNNHKFLIRDNKGTSRWSVEINQPYNTMAEDYSIISRVHDKTTEQMLVSAGGITKIGTIAAGEFLTSAKNMQALVKQAPANWENKSLQVVLATKVIRGNNGSSRIVATAFW